MDKKKITAALAAVAMYMKTQEEALLSSAPATAEPETEPAFIPQPAAQPFNLWGVSGRQTHMQANAMMQLRMFK
jgi:hypothetical protein